MKLDKKLPLAFLAVALLTFAAALFGLFQLNRSLNTFDTSVREASAQRNQVDAMAIEFRTQVQEWKNVLLRGKDPKQLDKHWSAFEKQEKSVATIAKELSASLHEESARSLVQQFAAAHAQMGSGYRKALAAFRDAQFDAAVGDKAVHGMDREPGRLLGEAGKKIEQAAQEVAAAAEAQGKRASLLSLVLMIAAAVISGIGGMLFSHRLMRQLGADPNDAVNIVQRVAHGDLSTPIQVRSGDAVSVMAQLKQMQDALTKVVSSVRSNADSVATASAQIAQGNLDLSQRTERQASALQQTAASMEQLGGNVGRNADSALEADRLVQGASEIAARGGAVFGQVVDTMKGINDSSRRIADIINVIDGIAFQTNILALNAAVEAARAGEQGRGFAVVAGEVRSLAQRSAGAAKEIKELINASVTRVAEGTALVDQAGTTMQDIVDSIGRVTTIIGEISRASSEQRTGVHEIGAAVSDMDKSTQQNAALVEESAAAADSLRTQARDLVQAVSVFKLTA